MKRNILLCIFFIIQLVAKSQNDTLFFRHFTSENGLSHHNVSSIVQDSLGFMWYGTQDGLNKFDGYKFIPFKHDPKNKNSLVSDDVTSLAVEKSGTIWIGTKTKGLNRYDSYLASFDLFKNDPKNRNTLSDDRITCLFSDTIHNLIWIGTENGLNSIEIKTKKITRYFHDEKNKNSINKNFISCITLDKTGNLWIGTNNGGINSFNFETGKFSLYNHSTKNKNSISSNIVRDAFVDKNNSVWIATDNGLNKFDIETKIFKLFIHDEKNKNSIICNNLTSVYQDKYGKIWTGSMNNGLCVYYPDRDKFYLYSHETEAKNSLSSNNINTVSQGRSGMFWAATKDGGLNSFNPKTLYFNLFKPIRKNIYENISSMFRFKNFLLIGTKNDGLYIYNNLTNELKKHSDFFDKNINCIFSENEDRILIGAENGMYEIYFEKGKFHYTKSKKYAIFCNEKISCIYKDKKNIFWFGTKENGLFYYDTFTKNILHFLQNENITCIAEDKNENIWAGTWGEGLKRFNRNGKTFTLYKNEDNSPYTLGGNYINKIFCDKKGTLWISTWCGGLNAFNSSKNNFICYTVHDGLPNNSMNEIIQDEKENLWINTDNGICRLTFKNENLLQCRIFDLVDGLPTTEFYNGAALKNSMGRLLFSCSKGIINFSPDSIKNNPYKPPVIISDFLVFNKNILPNDTTGILKTSVSVTKEIHLKYNQNSFSFNFTAISFINPMKNKYAYMLDGFDKEWIYKNAQNRTATYTNIEPGTYIFRVKASNNDGVWNDDGTSIKIIISSPFWKTWWFYTICFLFFAMVIYMIYYFRLQQIIKFQEMRNRISRDLHDEIGSTLGSISVYSEVAKKLTGEKVPESIPVITNLGESARIAMESMSDIVWAINPINDTFSKIVQRVQIFGNQLFSAKNINFHINFANTINDLKLNMQQRKNIYYIFKEALTNISKYANAKNCYIEIIHGNKYMEVQIRDDGHGFQPNPDNLGGNGILNMKIRAQELKGTLNIFSEPQKGTTLSLKFIS